MAVSSIATHFASLPDPRDPRGCRHVLSDLITITVLATICGFDGWAAVEDFGKAKRSWLKTFLHLPHGIPSHDCFGRLFAAFEPEAFERCLRSWTASLQQRSGGSLIAIDGKTSRRSADPDAKQPALHMVSAWCRDNGLVLGQLATEAKSNEITAIPKLLFMLDLRGAVVTIDAMGCQKDIAAAVRAGGGDYLLQVKKNHPTVHEEVKLLFDEADKLGFEGMRHARHKTVEKDHGRIETRQLDSVWDLNWFHDRADWPGLGCFVRVRSVREIGGKISREDRFWLCSLGGRDAERLLDLTRGHRSIENQLHWSLDVTFGEDHCRARKGHSAEHLSRVRGVALTLLKQETGFKGGIQRKRMRCAVDHDYLIRVLGA